MTVTYILGVNAGSATWHDASACLVDGTGTVLAFIEEERLSRVRHAPRVHMPTAAVARCLQLAGISAAEVDAVAVGWDEPRLHGGGWHFDSPAEFLHGLGFPAGVVPDVYFVPHHRAHAASAFYPSSYAAAVVLVVDGNGEDESMSLYQARRGAPLIRLASWPQVCSLGHAYEAVSRWLGLGKHGAGKVMGLAAYGERPAEDPSWLTVTDAGLVSALGTDTNLGYDELIGRWAGVVAGYAGAPGATAAPHDLAADPLAVQVAAAAQTTVESVLGALLTHARTLTGISEVCLAGGVGLNCAANGRLPGPLFVPPVPHDAGVAVGAAWAVLAPTEPLPFSPYTGGPPGLIPELVNGATAEDLDVDTVVELLLRGEVVGVCRGRSEVGPRALCHRSLLASPTSTAMRDTVNALKQREPWRPFGPVSLAGVEHGLWSPAGELERFMLGAAEVTSRGARDIPAVRHVDGTTRPQRLHAGGEPFVEAVLTGLARAGHPGALLNTSFNGPGEPVVETAAQALACARRLGVQFCVTGDRLVRIPPQPQCEE
jgi:carbamoyltransferase